ncbi:MAG TPA: hypothetical protein VIJ07_12400 [Dermatophilaceae bacterium]
MRTTGSADERETGGLRLSEPFVEDVDQSNGNVGFEGMPAKRIAEAVALGRLG